ncbi:MAG: hypothetical protein CL561_13435 [Alphaproteobacteria bacterium]|nr:hypothetical protein [Alphaproteobacteria bacterium]|tara:strand:+ start:3404 stop:4423 length:1020 start_codon:yes stop_codon:yes gene_type:complete
MHLLVHSSLWSLGYLDPNSTVTDDIKSALYAIADFIEQLENYPTCFCDDDILEFFSQIPDYYNFLNQAISATSSQEEFSTQDMFNFILKKIQSHNNDISDYVTTQEISYRETPDITPNNTLDGWPDNIKNGLLKTLAKIARTKNSKRIIPLCQAQNIKNYNNIKYKVCRELHRDASTEETFSPPIEITFREKIISNYKDINSAIEAKEIWTNATNNQELKLALRIALQDSTHIHKVDRVEIGTDFLNTLKRNSAHGSGTHAENVFNKCKQLIEGTLDYSDFRTTSAKNSPIITRKSDNAQARRAHITTGNPALRLLFWDKGNDYIELANIGPKKQLEII